LYTLSKLLFHLRISDLIKCRSFLKNSMRSLLSKSSFLSYSRAKFFPTTYILRLIYYYVWLLSTVARICSNAPLAIAICSYQESTSWSCLLLASWPCRRYCSSSALRACSLRPPTSCWCSATRQSSFSYNSTALCSPLSLSW